MLNFLLCLASKKSLILITELITFVTAFYVFRNERLNYPKLKVVNLCGFLNKDFLFLQFDVTNPTYSGLKLMTVAIWNSNNKVFVPSIFPHKELENKIYNSKIAFKMPLKEFKPIYISNGDSERIELIFDLSKNTIKQNEVITLVLETVTKKIQLEINTSELIDLWQS